MNAKKPIFFFLIFLLTVLTTGCWDYIELEDQGIIYAVAIDLEDVETEHHEKEDFEVGEEDGEDYDEEQSNKNEKQYIVTVQLIEPTAIMGGEKGGMTRGPSWNITTAKANSIKKAMEEINGRMYREPILSHIRVVIIGENLAREGLTGALDFIIRDPHIRKGTSVLVSQGKAMDALNLEHETIAFSGRYLSRISETSNKYGGAAKFSMTQLGINMFQSKSYVVPRITLSPAGNEVVYGGGAVFQSDKMIGWVGEREMTDINLIKEKDVINIPVSASCSSEDNNTFALRLESKKSKYDIKYINDQIHLNIKMYLIADVSEMNCEDVDILNDKHSKLIEHTFSRSLEKELTYTFKQIQKKFGTDLYNIDDYTKKYHYDIWKKVEKDWNKYFTELKLNIEVLTSLRTGGSENFK